jgi:hypothetical protein
MSEFKRMFPVFISILVAVTGALIAILSNIRAKKDEEDLEQ